ncbi:MAG: hypothetical protein RI953_2923 [Pseudomonadota bacterium]|jgi:secreted trypsin-like serine protease
MVQHQFLDGQMNKLRDEYKRNRIGIVSFAVPNTFLTMILFLLFAGCNPKSNSDADDRVSYGQRKFIVGGQDVTPSDAVAASTVVLINGAGKMRCSGTLIAARLVVSAAHCFVDPGLDNSNLSVGFGLNTSSLVTRSVKSFTAHPQYDANRPLGETAPLYDVALIELAEDAPSGTAFARVPHTSFDLNKGEPMLLAGFGLSYTSGSGTGRTGGGAGTLRKVTLPLNAVLMSSKQIKITSDSSQAVCSGDSGGPAYATSRENELVVSGVTSWGYSRCEDGLSVFTDLRKYSDWVVANSKGQLTTERLVQGSGQSNPGDQIPNPVQAPYTTVVENAFALLSDIQSGRISQSFGEIKDRNSGKYTKSFFVFFKNTDPKYYCVHIKGDGSGFSTPWGQKSGSYVYFDKIRVSELPNFDSFGCSWQSARSGWYWYLDM